MTILSTGCDVHNRNADQARSINYVQILSVPYEPIVFADEYKKTGKLSVHTNFGTNGTGELRGSSAFNILEDSVYILDAMGRRIMQVKNGSLVSETIINELHDNMVDLWVNDENDFYILADLGGLNLYRYFNGKLEKVYAFSALYAGNQVCFRDGKIILPGKPDGKYYCDIDKPEIIKESAWNISFDLEECILTDKTTGKKFKIIEDKSLCAGLYLLGRNSKNDLYMRYLKKVDDNGFKAYLLKLDLESGEMIMAEDISRSILKNDIFIDKSGDIYQAHMLNDRLVINKLVFE